jgi:hypothetical protein
VFEPLTPLPPWRHARGRPELNLYAEMLLDAVELVRLEAILVNTKPAHVVAARHWIEAGDIGVVTFNEACGWLGLDAEVARRAIFSAAGAA